MRDLWLAGGLLLVFGVAMALLCPPRARAVADRGATRSFHLGFAWQPYAWSEAAFADTGRLIAEHGDLIAIYFSGHIPWEEAATGAPYHPVQEAEIERRRAAIRPHQTVVLGVSLLASDRVHLAGDLGEHEAPRSGRWADKSFDDPEVVAAYLNYCRDMIRRFDPDYFIYAMEVDSGLTDAADPRFQRLLRAVEQIYPALKREFPALPVALEFMLENDEEMAKRAGVLPLLLPYTDLYAVSTYPFQMVGGDPAAMPDDWFARARRFAPGKPLAIAETNWLAESFYHPTQGIPVPFRSKRLLIPSTAAFQASYFETLLREADRLEAEFVVEWTIRDLDALQAIWDGSGGPLDSTVHGFAALATDCGFFDESGRERPALSVWRRWLARPRVGRPGSISP